MLICLVLIHLRPNIEKISFFLSKLNSFKIIYLVYYIAVTYLKVPVVNNCFLF